MQASTRGFWTIWTGQSVSLLGSQAVQFALIWWLADSTGSPTVLATAAFLGLLPQVILGPFIGAIVDRSSRRRVMLVADTVSACASLLLASGFALGFARTETVFALLFVRAVAGAFHAPAMLAATSLMVPQEHLARIQGLNQSLQGGAMIVTAPLGALLVGALPMAAVLLVDVATALPAILPLLFVKVPEPPRVNAAYAGGGLWGDVVSGLRYLGERQGHLVLLAIAAAVNLCLVPAFSLLPLLVRETGGGAAQLGWIQSALGLGMLAGGIVLGAWGGFRRPIVTVLSGLAALGVATLALQAAPMSILLAAVAAIFAVGFCAPLVNGPIQAVLQATIAPEFQGRVFTLYGTLAALATPLGLALAAPVAEVAGVRAWYVAGGVACIVLGAVGFLVPSLMRLGEPVDVQGPVVSAEPALGAATAPE